MRVALIITALVLLAGGDWDCAEARTFVHRHAYCGVYRDYGHTNVLAPLTYVYPVANWGPFFACHLYFGPVYVREPLVY
jgi:hypothetical protein